MTLLHVLFVYLLQITVTNKCQYRSSPLNGKNMAKNFVCENKLLLSNNEKKTEENKMKTIKLNDFIVKLECFSVEGPPSAC